MLLIKSGSTSQTVLLGPLLDSSSTTGAARTGLAHNTASLTASYCRPGADPVTITLASLASNTAAYSSGGFREINSTSHPGIYRLDLPDGAIAANASHVVVTIRGAANLVDFQERVALVALDPQDSTRAGLAALPTDAHNATAGLTTLANRFTGISSLADWLRLSFRADFTNATATAEIGGTFAAATDSLEAIRNRGDEAWTTGAGGGGGAGDWTTDERAQIRHRLGLDGTAAAPTSATPSLSSAASLTTLANRFTGISSLADWLRLSFRADFTNATATAEIGGTFAATTDSLEAIRNRGDAAWTTGAGGGGGGADPLTAAVPGNYAPGTAGHRLGQIGTAALTVTSPLTPEGNLELYAGDDYRAADGRALLWTNAAGTWPNLTAAALQLTAHRNGARRLQFPGTVQTPTGAQQIRFEPTAQDLPTPTDAAPSWEYSFAITATLSNGHTITLQTGTLTLRRAR